MQDKKYIEQREHALAKIPLLTIDDVEKNENSLDGFVEGGGRGESVCGQSLLQRGLGGRRASAVCRECRGRGRSAEEAPEQWGTKAQEDEEEKEQEEEKQEEEEQEQSDSTGGWQIFYTSRRICLFDFLEEGEKVSKIGRIDRSQPG